MKNSNGTIWNRTSDLPICSADREGKSSSCVAVRVVARLPCSPAAPPWHFLRSVCSKMVPYSLLRALGGICLWWPSLTPAFLFPWLSDSRDSLAGMWTWAILCCSGSVAASIQDGVVSVVPDPSLDGFVVVLPLFFHLYKLRTRWSVAQSQRRLLCGPVKTVL